MSTDKPRTILHVDLDAFYAAVEQRDDPALGGKPVIVGADPKGGKGRGVVATASYEARVYGVRSAMPISEAYRLCPQGIYIPPEMDKYAAVSLRIIHIVSAFTDLVEQTSIDEAFLDVTGSRALFGTGAEIAGKIKAQIREQEQLTCSIGVATNKFVAKVASDLQKPDGLVIVEPGKEKEFLAPLPIRRLWGVGRKTETVLQAMGFTRIVQIQSASFEELDRKFGKWGRALWDLANGRDESLVTPDEACKSIGHEDTFEKDTNQLSVLHRELLDLAERVAHRLRENRVRGRTVVIKLRYADFSTLTRRKTMHEPTSTSEIIFEIAHMLFKQTYQTPKKIRLLGIYVTNLEPAVVHDASLFSSPHDLDKLAEAVDKITKKYGPEAIQRAALSNPLEKLTKRPGPR